MTINATPETVREIHALIVERDKLKESNRKLLAMLKRLLLARDVGLLSRQYPVWDDARELAKEAETL